MHKTKTAPSTTRRQHYVWRSYLVPWTADEKISVLRRDRNDPFKVHTKNVAVERDFYRLQELEPSDAKFIADVAIKPMRSHELQKLNIGWIQPIDVISRLVRQARTLSNGDPENGRQLDELLIQYDETAHADRENAAVPFFRSLVAGDLGFFEESEENAVHFLFFVTQQYFRTKAIRDRMRAQFESDKHLALFDRCWPVFRHIYATNVGYSIYANRAQVPPRIIEAAPGTFFMTGDQPVINVAATLKLAGEPLEEKDFELFYPVSPTRAVIFSDDPAYAGKTHITIDAAKVAYFNRAIVAEAHEQLFASTIAQLEPLTGVFR